MPSADVLARMTATLVHRGPDGSGHWLDDFGTVGLGHRRLAVVDISDAGRQPMVSSSGRYIITFNGEVYNFVELRKELERGGGRFRGHSDTEVMLEAFEQWGVNAATRRFNGMFAFAVWDCAESTLTLARDRLGKKPLYVFASGRSILFASELKALRAVPGLALDIDRDAVTLYLRYNCVPAPRSIYTNVSKIEPGTIATVKVSDSGVGPVQSTKFWDVRNLPYEPHDAENRLDVAAAEQELERILVDAVRIRMIADVPLGAFLSGGIDSSLVVAMMQRISASPVRTFTIGFESKEYDESRHADAVARHLGTDHTEVRLTGRDALDVVPRLPEIYDEPFADSSQIPTFLVSQIARSKVTVALSGDGGDEGFLGYSRYVWTDRLLTDLARLPVAGRMALSRMLLAVPSTRWDDLAATIRPLLPARWRYSAPGDRLHKFAALMAITDPAQLYRSFVSHWKDPASVVIGGTEPPSAFDGIRPCDSRTELVEEMARQDLLGYLPDDILVKVDRASMAVSLETRAPLLDYRVIEFAARLPFDLRLRGGQGKWLLRQLLAKYLPRSLIDRPKMGFGVPLDSWLRGPLRDWAESLLSTERLRREAYFRPEPIRKLWSEHLSGRRQWQYHLWDVLMFQAWLESLQRGQVQAN